MNSICELSIAYPDQSYNRLFSLSENRFLALEISDLAIRRFVFDCLLLTRSGIYLPESINNHNYVLYHQFSMIQCDIRVKMISPTEERIRYFHYEDPGKSEYLSAVNYEIDAYSINVDKTTKKQRSVWTPSVVMDNKSLLRQNQNELRRTNKMGGLLIICDGNDLPTVLKNEITIYRAGQVVLLCDRYSHFMWRFPKRYIDIRVFLFNRILEKGGTS
jgi:hypothetical protein